MLGKKILKDFLEIAKTGFYEENSINKKWLQNRKFRKLELSNVKIRPDKVRFEQKITERSYIRLDESNIESDSM